MNEDPSRKLYGRVQYLRESDANQGSIVAGLSSHHTVVVKADLNVVKDGQFQRHIDEVRLTCREAFKRLGRLTTATHEVQGLLFSAAETLLTKYRYNHEAIWA